MVGRSQGAGVDNTLATLEQYRPGLVMRRSKASKAAGERLVIEGLQGAADGVVGGVVNLAAVVGIAKFAERPLL